MAITPFYLRPFFKGSSVGARKAGKKNVRSRGAAEPAESARRASEPRGSRGARCLHLHLHLHLHCWAIVGALLSVNRAGALLLLY